MIDIHTHILPGIDDGAKDIQTSLAMARIAVNDGVHTVIATPHVITDVFNNTPEIILQTIDTLQADLEKEGIPLTICPGGEYRIEPDLARRLADGQCLTLAGQGKYLLVELPAGFLPDFTDDVLYQIQLQGVTPVIAHPERNHALMREPRQLREYIRRGMLSQLTTGSIQGKFGSKVKKASIQFIQDGSIHFLASDTHSDTHRTPMLSEASQELDKRFTPTISIQLHTQNPENILKNQEIPPIPKPKTPWPKRLLKK